MPGLSRKSTCIIGSVGVNSSACKISRTVLDRLGARVSLVGQHIRILCLAEMPGSSGLEPSSCRSSARSTGSVAHSAPENRTKEKFPAILSWRHQSVALVIAEHPVLQFHRPGTILADRHRCDG